jgi:hypothetical protein
VARVRPEEADALLRVVPGDARLDDVAQSPVEVGGEPPRLARLGVVKVEFALAHRQPVGVGVPGRA